VWGVLYRNMVMEDELGKDMTRKDRRACEIINPPLI
jgi:hypothetical protein